VGRGVGASVGPAVGAGVRWLPAVGAGGGVGAAAAGPVGARSSGPPGVPAVTGVAATTPGPPEATGDDPGGIEDPAGVADGYEVGGPTGTGAGTLPPVPDDRGTLFRSAVARTIVTSSPKPTPTAVWRYNGSMLRSRSMGGLHPRTRAGTIGARDRRRAYATGRYTDASAPGRRLADAYRRRRSCRRRRSFRLRPRRASRVA
jgi:hypothetical protein